MILKFGVFETWTFLPHTSAPPNPTQEEKAARSLEDTWRHMCFIKLLGEVFCQHGRFHQFFLYFFLDKTNLEGLEPYL